MTCETVIRSFSPVYNEKCRILILGTMASPASLAAGFYYAHPRNTFWKILGDLTGDDPGQTKERKAAFLLRSRIALWDTLASCERKGSSDNDIRSQVPNDVAGVVRKCPELRAVFLNGSAAFAFYRKYHAGSISLPFFRLPSTSPANARGGYEKKRAAWRAILPFLSETS